MPILNFKGKSVIQNHHHTVKFHELDPVKAKSTSKTPSLDDNLIIHGDNLKALKALLPTHAGKVKSIFIDPPYNTGNEHWAYNDNVNSPMIKEWLGKEVVRDDLTRHDKWCCMMYPRLILLRELLHEDGVIFVSIDDNELVHLRMMMDEIFGAENFFSLLIWKSRQIVDSRNKNKISIDHEYVVVYSKNQTTAFRGRESEKSKYSNPDKDPRGPWMSNSILGLANKEQRPNLHYSITDPKSGIKFECPPDTGWRYSKESMEKKINEGRIVFPKKKDGRPREKKFLSELTDEYTGFSSILLPEVGHTLNGTRDLREILGEESFPFPKPYTLIKNLLSQVVGKDDIVLDSFAGSGTTAHAVLDMNDEDGGNRKFILIECEDYADKITAERVRRIAKGVKEAEDEKLKKGLGGTFSFYELGDPLDIDDLLDGKKLPSFENLAQYAFYTATGETFDPSKAKEKESYIGSSSSYELFMLYAPDADKLREMALNLDFAEQIEKKFPKKPKLVFAPACYLEEYDLRDRNIRFAQLPFEIYRLAA